MPTELRSRITGTGSYVADGVLTNQDLERIVDTNDDWITERTGIKERRIASREVASSDMAAAATRNALEMAGLGPNDLDMIICATVTPDRQLPATAAYVQRKIGATSNCASFDIAAACAGSLYGISIADSFIRTGRAKHVAVIGVELLSRVLDYKDRNTCVLFGDGAGAMILSADQGESGVLSTHLFTDGSLTDILHIPAGGSALPTSAETVERRMHYVRMEGRDVFKYAVKYLADAAKVALDANAIGADDLSLVVAHQANIRILDAVSKRLGISLDRFILNLERFGNTSSASVPLALDEAVRGGRVHSGDTILMIALGGGISWGSAMVRW
ncbi:MAG: ketoacyl-ACP synthase III [Myxococcota bacterium]|jgi:3-oxoacyl-[acyl-carrier-protein] synthase-3|nr:ketoacyl-ACP synthase III [Myxococcota bacterium]